MVMVGKKAVVSSTPTTANSSGGGLWEDAPTEFTRRVVFMEIYGDTGTGRTSLALSAPGPIAFLHAAEKIDGIIQQFAHKIGPNGDGTEGVFNFGGVYNGTPQQVANAANEKWMRFVKAYFNAYSWARTIVIDTHTELWELIRLARFGGLKPTGGRVDANYGPVNAEFRSLFKHVKTQDRASLILIGQTKDEYTKTKGKSDGMGERTGRTIRAGMKEVPYMCDILARTAKDSEDGERLFTVTLEKAWLKAEMENIALTDQTIASLAALSTGTDAEEWEG